MPLIPCFDNHCFNCPFQFSVKLTEEIFAHCWTLCAAKHVCFLVGRNDSWASKLVQYLLLWFFHNTRHLHLPLGVQSPAESVPIPVKHPFVAPQGYQHESDLPAMFRALPPGNLPHGHLQSLFFLVGRQTSFLYFRGCKREFRFPYLHCCSVPISIHFMDSGGHLKGAHGDICLLIPVTFHTWKEVRMGIDMSYFKAPLKFP